MLHELFLLLSGNPSPLLPPQGLSPSFPLVSPSERALLNSLAALGHLHISLRNACSLITTSHPSTIARAVASGIDTHHLHAFRSRILLVEESILKREAGIVGGYDIVSLAKVLGAFEGWERTLRYLHDLANTILPGSANIDGDRKDEGTPLCGADLINRLRSDIYTGFPTLEAVSLDLLKIAETAWLREISTWILYGRLPSSSSYGSNSASSDFFITEVEGEVVQNPGGEEETGVLKEYKITKRLLPKLVPSEAASSILFIGRVLSIIRLRGGSAVNETSFSAVASSDITLLPIHLSYLQSLQPPLSPQKLSSVVAAIRLSLSRHALQTLLPAARIMDTIQVLREFYLLGRGEFALSIVEQASERVRHRWRRGGAALGSKTPAAGAGPLVKEGEVSAILTRTWGVLSSLQGEEVIDERLDTARDLLYLSLHKPLSGVTPATRGRPQSESFKDLLVGVPISLNFHLSWPLELFLQPADLDDYDNLFAYLISVRKALMRLQSLWQGRRPPKQNADLCRPAHRNEAKLRRSTLVHREAMERRIWACAAIAVFFLETLLAYWQSEVIEGAFAALVAVVTPQQAAQDEDEDEDNDMDIWASESVKQDSVRQDPQSSRKQQDPESLTRAHRAYLTTLERDLFMSDIKFAPLLKKFLLECEALAGGIERLLQKNSMADLELDNVTDESEYEREAVLEKCGQVRRLLDVLTKRLQKMDEEREGLGEDDVFAIADSAGGGARGAGATVDRLLMRLDLGSLGAV